MKKKIEKANKLFELKRKLFFNEMNFITIVLFSLEAISLVVSSSEISPVSELGGMAGRVQLSGSLG